MSPTSPQIPNRRIIVNIDFVLEIKLNFINALAFAVTE